MRGADGTYDGVLILGVEMTQEVRVRQEAQARLAFEERLTAIVGHDLRSPLAALSMSASQLLTGGQHADGLTAGQTRAVERVARGAQRLQAVIGSVLDLTRARGERGFPIQPAPSDLDVTARGVFEELRASHPERLVNYEHRSDTRGHFDPDRIAQVVVNLMENAFKYGDADSPVSLRCEGVDGWLRLVVHNTGTPIDAELQARLFQPFVRGTQSTETVKVSMGLGLYIVREIVRAHGGRITLDSSAEGGTTFTVELIGFDSVGLTPTYPRRSPDGYLLSLAISAEHHARPSSSPGCTSLAGRIREARGWSTGGCWGCWWRRSPAGRRA